MLRAERFLDDDKTADCQTLPPVSGRPRKTCLTRSCNNGEKKKKLCFAPSVRTVGLTEPSYNLTV